HVGGVTLHQPLFGGRGELGLEHGDRVEHGGGDADRYRGGGGGNAAQGAGHGVGEGGGAGGGGGEGDGAVAVVDYRTQGRRGDDDHGGRQGAEVVGNHIDDARHVDDGISHIVYRSQGRRGCRHGDGDDAGIGGHRQGGRHGGVLDRVTELGRSRETDGRGEGHYAGGCHDRGAAHGGAYHDGYRGGIDGAADGDGVVGQHGDGYRGAGGGGSRVVNRYRGRGRRRRRGHGD